MTSGWRQGLCELQGERPDLWRSSRLARCPGGGRLLRPAQDRASDAFRRLCGHDPAGEVFRRMMGSGHLGHRAQCARSPVHGVAAEPEVDRELYLRLDGGRLALCGRRDRPLLAACRRLVDEAEMTAALAASPRGIPSSTPYAQSSATWRRGLLLIMQRQERKINATRIAA